jgi:hypothetical protein
MTTAKSKAAERAAAVRAVLTADRLALADSAYIEQIASLSKEVTAGNDARLLLLALGCCEVKEPRGNGWRFERPKSPGAQHEVLISSTLQTLLHEHVRHRIPSNSDAISIVDGLQQNDRWREVIKTIDGAYDFAVLLAQMTASIWSGWTGVHSVETPKTKTDFTRSLRLRMIPIVTEITNEWIAPRKLPGGVTPKNLLGALFGDAWYSLFLEAGEEDLRNWDIRETIMAANPVFAPGLVSAQIDDIGLPLPDLVSP